jgi:hypothetical protein
MVPRARDAVIEQFPQMLRAASYGMRPKHEYVRKFPVLGTLDCHSEMAVLLPEAQPRPITGRLPYERGDLFSSEVNLHLHPA